MNDIIVYFTLTAIACGGISVLIFLVVALGVGILKLFGIDPEIG